MEYFPSLQDFFILLIHTRPLEWIGGIFSCALRYVFFFYFLTAVFFSCVLLTLTLYFILISVSSMSLFLSLLIPHFVPLVAYCPLPSDSLHYLIFLGTRPSYSSFCAFFAYTTWSLHPLRPTRRPRFLRNNLLTYTSQSSPLNSAFACAFVLRSSLVSPQPSPCVVWINTTCFSRLPSSTMISLALSSPSCGRIYKADSKIVVYPFVVGVR